MENYIVINRKKAKLTQEQLVALGIKIDPEYEVDPIFGLEWSETMNKQMTWEEAIKYSKTLRDGWRLPTAFELSMMFDKCKNTTIINGFNTLYDYWSSTTYVHNTDYVWLSDFYYGNVNAYGKASNNYARFVRGEQKFNNIQDYKEWLLKG